MGMDKPYKGKKKKVKERLFRTVLNINDSLSPDLCKGRVHSVVGGYL